MYGCYYTVRRIQKVTFSVLPNREKLFNDFETLRELLYDSSDQLEWVKSSSRSTDDHQRLNNIGYSLYLSYHRWRAPYRQIFSTERVG